MNTTKIEWADKSWNPFRGCTRVSSGCGLADEGGCYAEVIAARFSGPGQPFEGFAERKNGHAHWTGKVALLEDELQKALRWRWPKGFYAEHGRKPRVFTPSMSDPFHEGFTNKQIDQFFAVMALRPEVVFQVLTKRPERMREYFCDGTGIQGCPDGLGRTIELPRSSVIRDAAIRMWSQLPGTRRVVPLSTLPNVWLGTSVENQETADERIPHLLQTPAAVRFVSYEPALEGVTFDADWLYPRCKYCGRHSGRQDGHPICEFQDCGMGPEWEYLGLLDQIIFGGESGPKARPCDLAWARSVRDQCREAGTKLFLKQLGACVLQRLVTQEEVESRQPFAPDHEWPPGTRFGNRTGNPEYNGRQVLLKDSHGGDESEWPADLKGCREFPQ